MRADDQPSAFRWSALGALLIVVGAVFLGWSLFSRSMEPPPIEGQLYGVTYAPYAKDQDAWAFGEAKERLSLRDSPKPQDRPSAAEIARATETIRHNAPRREQIERDMRTLAGRVRYVRTYSALDGLEELPKIADQYGLKVVAGAWVYDHIATNPKKIPLRDYFKAETEREIASLIRLANANPNVERVIVGNETILRGEISARRMVEYIRQVKRNVKVPVSTAEPWHVWLLHRELGNEVDFIAVHILPYHDPDAGPEGAAYLVKRLEQLRAAYPNKNIIVTEVGWPSNGASRIGGAPGAGHDLARELPIPPYAAEDGFRTGSKNATPAMQVRHIREAVALLRERNIDHFVIEAFDQPWKSHDLEGMAGGYWGMFDADRQPKFDWTGPVTAFADWWHLALYTLALVLPVTGLFLWHWRNVRFAGELVFGLVTAMAASGLAYAFAVGGGIYMRWYQVAGWTLLTLFLLLSLAMLLAQAVELAETIWRRRWRRAVPPAGAVLAGLPAIRRWPKVSLHLAICNEPPAMVKETLDSLAALDYPNFEVIVIDNNTRDPAVWRPVEEHCQQLGSRFRFFHFDVMKGFKAGALNHVLTETAPDAEIIGVIDSDYVVRKDWLKALVPQFDDPKIGYVQAPQDHRDWRNDRFKEMLQWEYAGFFDIGMCTRNEYDALIQHGTMTLIRRSLMDQLGGWAVWCITEDTEFGLRAMEHGYSAAYSRERFGQGLTPDNFSGYKKQRFRWAYGAMQILKGHRQTLLSNRTKLTFWQKYHFCTGWLPWFADALNVIFTVTGILWAIGFLTMPQYIPLPPAVFLVPTLALFVFKLIYSFALYGARVDCSFRQSIGAALAGLSLTYTVGKAVLYGLFTSKLPFIRTPKMDSRATLARALAMARDEAVLTGLLLLAAWAVPFHSAIGKQDPTAWLWAVLLLVQSLPYAAAVFVSVVNAVEQMRQARALVIPAPAPPLADATATVPLAAGD